MRHTLGPSTGCRSLVAYLGLLLTVDCAHAPERSQLAKTQELFLRETLNMRSFSCDQLQMFGVWVGAPRLNGLYDGMRAG